MKQAKLTIGIVIDTTLDLTDGVQQYVFAVGDWLQSKGHVVHYLSGEANPDKHPNRMVYSLAKNITVNGNNNTMSIPLYGKRSAIRSVMSETNFDVLHVQMPYHPLMAGAIISKAASTTAVVATFHIVGGSKFIDIGTRLLGIVQRSTNNRIDSFISVSTAAERYLSQTTNKSSVVLPNVVNVEKMKHGKTKKFLQGERATIVFLGRLVDRKGAQHLLAALKVLLDRNQLSGVRVHLCGDGPMREELESFVVTYGLQSHVLFHGFIEESEKPDYLASADIAIFPATGGESFGIVLIEAMAAGSKVVLAGNNEGYATVMEGSSNQLFDPRNHSELADMISHYIEDRPASDAAKKWQKQRVEDFDIEHVGPKLVAHYQKVIATRT